MFPVLLGKNKDLEKRVKELEEGGGGGGENQALIVNVTLNEDFRGTMDKTYKEIFDALKTNGVVFHFHANNSYAPLDYLINEAGLYEISVQTLNFFVENINDYPRTANDGENDG